MITRKTVLVLGAGASMPYNMPSGFNLLSEICSYGKPPSRLKQMLDAWVIPTADFRSFALSLERSGLLSIDTFLGRRLDLARLGKLAITYVITQREAIETVTRLQNDDDWYRYLWHRMVTDAESAADVSRNTVRFVTFNYDRSLEAFLYHATRDTFGVQPTQAMEVVNGLPIKHAYGSVGPFHPVLAGRMRPYEVVEDARIVALAAEDIRVIPESRSSDDEFQEIRRWFDWADDVCFLGFGFDELNVERLGLGSVVEYKRGQGQPIPRIIASTYGKTPVEVTALKAITARDVNWTTVEGKNLQVFRNVNRLLT